MSIHPDVTITIPGNLTSPPYLRGLRTLLDATRWSFLADQIEAQSKPPRIPEPGLWGVVEAVGQRDMYEARERLTWVRTDGDVWRNDSCGYGVAWGDLENPTLVRPGIE